MAELITNDKKVLLNTAATTYVWGDPGIGGASAWEFHIVSNGATGSITVSARERGQQAQDDAVAMVAIPYRSEFLNGAVGTGLLVSTAITGTSLISVPAGGRSIGLNLTALSAGTFTVYANPVADFVA